MISIFSVALGVAIGVYFPLSVFISIAIFALIYKKNKVKKQIKNVFGKEIK